MPRDTRVDDRGARATEAYGNRFTVTPGAATPPFTMADVSSGTALVWGNVADVGAVKNIIIFKVTRRSTATYSQAAPAKRLGLLRHRVQRHRVELGRQHQRDDRLSVYRSAGTRDRATC